MALKSNSDMELLWGYFLTPTTTTTALVYINSSINIGYNSGKVLLFIVHIIISITKQGAT